MSQTKQKLDIFENGATWLRADFHLHTKADAEFKYEGDPNYFASSYIAQLEKQDIRIGVITNHNKFDIQEFKELKKNAIKKEIYLLPGIEFSVKDGSKGLHILIAFDDTWISDNHNYIQDFITSAFSGIDGYDSPQYKNSKFTFEETCTKLKEFQKDFFIVLAHVNDSSGLFEELKGRGLEDFVTSEFCKNHVLAFQKVRSVANKQFLSGKMEKLPAYVEGSDSAAAGIEGIGEGNEIGGVPQKTFIKLGAFNFDALKFALIDYKERVKDQKPELSGAYLKSITYDSKRLGKRVLHFSPSLNNFIGIRGSGKSSILETIRYILDIPLTANAKDKDYKEGVVRELLGSGGKMVLELVDNTGKVFVVEKIYGENSHIYQEGILQRNLQINALINKPIYYGQKDLSELGGEASTEDLVTRLIGSKLQDVQIKIEEKISQIQGYINDLRKVRRTLEQRQETEAKKAEIELKLDTFKKYEIDKKLDKQVEFNKDRNRLDNLEELSENIINSLTRELSESLETLKNISVYASKENADIFTKADNDLIKFKEELVKIQASIAVLRTINVSISGNKKELLVRYESLTEEFSKIKREINIPNLNADAYVLLSKELDMNVAKLVEIKKIASKQGALQKNLQEATVALKGLWHSEYQIVNEQINTINADQDAIQISVEFKGAKDKFKSFLQEVVRGSGLTTTVITKITEAYRDLIDVYYDFGKEDSPIKNILAGGDNYLKFQQKFNERINDCLSYRVPDKYSIQYKGKPLSEHSLGQRASAMILFILTLRENDLIIIDQPEDDLDNQTIYSEVIAELKKLKDKTQFVFATHNPNIPVLGDCEQVFACEFLKDHGADHIETSIGSIDEPTIQKKIVEIMEGGEDAFNQRKIIYQLWKH